MEFENIYIVYVKLNDSNYIVSVNSSEFISDLTNWIEIDRGSEYRYHHAQNNYFSNPIVTNNGAYRYKLINNMIVECTKEEIENQEELIRLNQFPSQLDIIEAQVTYTALMTDTLLEV